MRCRPGRFKIVHATNHPGIEGSRQIRDAITSLVAKGHAIDFVELNGVTHDRVLAELADADLSIGKMKMGYYANLQVESLAAGVPAVTCIREEFVTDAIRESGLILASLDTLQTVIEHYLTHPEELARKRAIARASVLALHDNTAIADQVQSTLRAVARAGGGMNLRRATVALWAAVVLLVAVTEIAFQTRTGHWTWLWSEVPIGAVQTEQGFAFVGHTGRPEVASHVSLQATALLEDGVQLGLRNAQHSEIREVGLGRYSFWQDYVLFAASDNSDPRTNGRRYSMTFPRMSRQVARAIYGTTLLVFLLAIGCTWAALRAGALGVPAALARFVRAHALLVVTILTAESLVLPALLRTTSSSSPLADDVWPGVLLLHLLLAIVVRVQWGSRVPTAVLTASLLALVIGYVLLTAWAPHRTQGCHTNGESYPVWTMCPASHRIRGVTTSLTSLVRRVSPSIRGSSAP